MSFFRESFNKHKLFYFSSVVLVLLILIVGLLLIHMEKTNGQKTMIENIPPLYAENPNDFFVVSMDPKSGIPVDPEKVKNIVVRFNHPVNLTSVNQNFMMAEGSKYTFDAKDLSDNGRVLTIPIINRKADYIPDLFSINRDMKDTRGNRLANYINYTYRRVDKLKRKYAALNKFDPHHKDSIKNIKKSFEWSNRKDLSAFFGEDSTIGEPFHRYPKMAGEKRPAYEEHSFPEMTLYSGLDKKWKTSDLAGKNTLFIIQMWDGRIPSPDPTDIAKIVLTCYKPEKLRIVICNISADKQSVDTLQKQLGNNIIIVSDLQGCCGPIFNYLVHSKTMLPLFFFIDEKGIIKLSCTGFPNISGVIEGFLLMGMLPDLPNPADKDIIRIQKEINNNPFDSDSYLEMAQLYKKSGNSYMETLYEYEALLYGKKDPVMQKKVFDNFMKMGMYVEAFDTMADGHFKNPADAEKHYYAALAARRLGHPNVWDLNKHFNLRANACQQSGGFEGKENILFAHLLWSYYQKNGKYLEFGDPPAVPSTIDYQSEMAKIIEFSDNYIKNNPGVGEPFILKADAYWVFSNEQEVYKCLKKAEECSDFTAHNMADLAESTSNLGQISEGKILAEKALKGSSSVNIHMIIARACLYEKDLKEGAKELEKFISLNMWQEKAYELYSMVLFDLGDRKKALEYGQFYELVSPTKRRSDMTIYMDVVYPYEPSKRLNE